MDLSAVAPTATGAARRLLGSEEQTQAPSIFQSQNGRMASSGVAVVVVAAILAPILLFALGLMLVKRLKRRRRELLTLPGAEEPPLPKAEPSADMGLHSGAKGKQSFLGALAWSSGSSSASSDKHTLPTVAAIRAHLDGDVPGLKIIRANSSRAQSIASMIGTSKQHPGSCSVSCTSNDSMATAATGSTSSSPGPEEA